ncbi:MAG: hypothetical protein AB1585_04920 [Thermodesulfobacteriota bacterium]
MNTASDQGGYRRIFEDLFQELAELDLAAAAKNLGLSLNEKKEVQVPFFSFIDNRFPF